MRKTTSLILTLSLAISTVLPYSSTVHAQEADDIYNEHGIKWGTEVFGEDISKLTEEELQYIPEGWRDGIIEDIHPEEHEDEQATLQASYPDVNQYIKDRGYDNKVANIEYSYISHLPKFGYRGGTGKVEGVVAHETANNNSTITSEIQYMTRNYYNAFVHSFIDHQRIIEIHPTKYGAWGAGRYANQRFVHVELVRVKSFDAFARSINNYANYIAQVLFDYDLGVSDAEKSGKGTLWSHKAVSTHLGGTSHVDPHGYFSNYGYSWNDFVDLVTERYNSFKLPRVEGTNRYQTAVKVSSQGWKTSDRVILARGTDYADALAGVPLAKHYDAPLLLTQPTTLTDASKKEIQRLGTKTVTILGGTAAISKQVESQLKSMGITVERISGDNRLETAIEIANIVLAGKSTKQVALVNGYNFADALAVAPYAAQKGIPIILTRQKQLPDQTKQLFENLNISKTYVVGGTQAIADRVISGLPNVTRVSGSTRYATAVELAKTFAPNGKNFYVSTGSNFPDSLAAAAVAAKQNRGLLLVNHSVPTQVENYINKQGITNLTVVGGAAAVNRIVEREMKKLIN